MRMLDRLRRLEAIAGRRSPRIVVSVHANADTRDAEVEALLAANGLSHSEDDDMLVILHQIISPDGRPALAHAPILASVSRRA